MGLVVGSEGDEQDLPHDTQDPLQQALGMVQAWRRQAERIDRDAKDLLHNIKMAENSLLDSMVRKFNKP